MLVGGFSGGCVACVPRLSGMCVARRVPRHEGPWGVVKLALGSYETRLGELRYSPRGLSAHAERASWHGRAALPALTKRKRTAILTDSRSDKIIYLIN